MDVVQQFGFGENVIQLSYDKLQLLIVIHKQSVMHCSVTVTHLSRPFLTSTIFGIVFFVFANFLKNLCNC